MKIEVAPHAFLYNGLKTPAFACVFADRPFLNDVGDTILASKDPRKMVNYVKRVAITGADGVWQISAFSGANELDSNTDSITSETVSTYTLSIFSANGVFLDFISTNVKLSDEVNPTTWLHAIEYSRARSQPYRAEYYDTNAIDRLLSEIVVLPGGGGGGFTHLNEFASLSAAIAGIGVDQTTLYILEDVAVSANTTIPSNIRLQFFDQGKITVSAGQTLTINGPIDAAGNAQIFDGAGAVRFAQGAVDAYKTAWRTGLGNPDLTFAINEGLANVAIWGGGEIIIPAGNWTTAGGHVVTTGTTITGAGGRVRDVDGTGTYIKSTAATRMFQFGGGVYFQKYSGLQLDGDSLLGTSAIYGEGTAGIDQPSHGLLIEDCTIRGFVDNIYLNSLAGTDWQVANVSVRDSFLISNGTTAFRCNSSNMDSISFKNTMLYTNSSRLVWAERVFNIGFDSCSFSGSPLNLKGVHQSEYNTVVAPAGITANGSASVTVTWPSLSVSTTVSVPLNTTDHTTAASIASAIALALENVEDLSEKFWIGTRTSTLDRVVLVAIDPAANDAAANFTIETGTATGITDSLTSTAIQAGALPLVGDLPAFEIDARSNNATFINCVEEGFGTFVKATGSALNFTGCTVLDKIHGTSPFSTSIHTTGNRYLPKILQASAAGIDLNTSIGDNPQVDSIVGGTDVRLVSRRWVRYGTDIIRTDYPYKRVVVGGRLEAFDPSLEPTDDPMVKIVSTDSTKNLLQIGYQAGEHVDEPLSVYNFRRDGPTGYLSISPPPALQGSNSDGMLFTGRVQSAVTNITREQNVSAAGVIGLDLRYSNRFYHEPTGDNTFEIPALSGVEGSLFYLTIRTVNTVSRAMTFGTGFNPNIPVFHTGTVSGQYYMFTFMYGLGGIAQVVGDPRMVPGPMLSLYDNSYIGNLFTPRVSRLSVGSTTSQAIPDGQHYVGFDLDQRITPSNTGAMYTVGIRNTINLGGASSTGNHTIYGTYNSVNSSGSGFVPAGTVTVYGHYTSVDIAANAGGAELIGAHASCLVGSVNVGVVPTVVGQQAAASVGYSATVANAAGGSFWIQSGSNSGGVTTDGAAIWARRRSMNSQITNLYGVRIGPYDGSVGVIPTTSYGLFIDSTVDGSGTTTFAIKSNATARSEFAGSITQVYNTAHLAADDTHSGDLISGFVNSGGVTQWDAVYLNSSSQWVIADANAAGAFPALGLAVATAATTVAVDVIKKGLVRNDAWAWTPGLPIYLDIAAGGLSQTAPSASGDCVQVMGFAMTADQMFLDPQLTWIKLV